MYHEIGFKYTSRPPREIGKPQAHHASRRQEGLEAAASAEYITGRTDGLCPFRGNLRRSGWKSWSIWSKKFQCWEKQHIKVRLIHLRSDLRTYRLQLKKLMKRKIRDKTWYIKTICKIKKLWRMSVNRNLFVKLNTSIALKSKFDSWKMSNKTYRNDIMNNRRIRMHYSRKT